VQSHDEQDDDEQDSDEHDEGTDKMSVSMLASSSAAFWQRMLRLRWDRLQAEEAEALLEQEIHPMEGAEDDASGMAQPPCKMYPVKSDFPTDVLDMCALWDEWIYIEMAER